jgi:hypothetical protein
MRIVLNPMAKLEWFAEHHSAGFVAQVKAQLLEAVSTLKF